METFITAWPLWAYLIGISIAYAAIEEIDNQIVPVNLLAATMWPALLCMVILACILWPTYYLTKKLINYLKHIKSNGKTNL